MGRNVLLPACYSVVESGATESEMNRRLYRRKREIRKIECYEGQQNLEVRGTRNTSRSSTTQQALWKREARTSGRWEKGWEAHSSETASDDEVLGDSLTLDSQDLRTMKSDILLLIAMFML